MGSTDVLEIYRGLLGFYPTQPRLTILHLDYFQPHLPTSNTCRVIIPRNNVVPSRLGCREHMIKIYKNLFSNLSPNNLLIHIEILYKPGDTVRYSRNDTHKSTLNWVKKDLFSMEEVCSRRVRVSHSAKRLDDPGFWLGPIIGAS